MKSQIVGSELLVNYWEEFIALMALHTLAVIGPGPDFALIVRNSLSYSRRVGIYTALGIALGIVVHISYSLLGVGLMISNAPAVFRAIQLLGAAYLFYLGVLSLLLRRPAEQKVIVPRKSFQRNRGVGALDGVRMGFVTNLLNPKATLWFLGIFTQLVHPSTGNGVKVFYGFCMVLVAFFWFALLSHLLTAGFLQRKIGGIQFYLEKVMGLMLVGIAIKIAFFA